MLRIICREKYSGWKLLNIFAKRSFLDVWQGSEYTSEYICCLYYESRHFHLIYVLFIFLTAS